MKSYTMNPNLFMPNPQARIPELETPNRKQDNVGMTPLPVACLSSFSAAHDIVCKLVEGNPLAASVMVPPYTPTTPETQTETPKHPTLYTPHPAPYTLHPHSPSNTLNPKQDTDGLLPLDYAVARANRGASDIVKVCVQGLYIYMYIQLHDCVNPNPLNLWTLNHWPYQPGLCGRARQPWCLGQCQGLHYRPPCSFGHRVQGLRVGTVAPRTLPRSYSLP